jgi:hypothetical protein
LGIVEADLVVADLTDGNPNVYYELGLAHALRKRVILLTQEAAALPFDLRAYRVVEYDTHFARIDSARGTLLDLARGAASGQTVFGNPVSDFAGVASVPESSEVEHPAPTSNGKEDVAAPGSLDQLIAIEEGLPKLTEHVYAINKENETIGADANRASEHLSRLASSGQLKAREARAIVMDLGGRLSRYAEFLREKNSQYVADLVPIREALEGLISAQQPSGAEERKNFHELIGVLEQGASNSAVARSAVVSLASTMRGIPRLERSFNLAANQAAREVERYAENLELTSSTFMRAVEVGRTRLPDGGESGGTTHPAPSA